nr:hypothetical protein CFP56_30813 [Quercus suber]
MAAQQAGKTSVFRSATRHRQLNNRKGRHCTGGENILILRRSANLRKEVNSVRAQGTAFMLTLRDVTFLTIMEKQVTNSGCKRLRTLPTAELFWRLVMRVPPSIHRSSATILITSWTARIHLLSTIALSPPVSMQYIGANAYANGKVENIPDFKNRTLRTAFVRLAVACRASDSSHLEAGRIHPGRDCSRYTGHTYDQALIASSSHKYRDRSLIYFASDISCCQRLRIHVDCGSIDFHSRVFYSRLTLLAQLNNEPAFPAVEQIS